MRHTTLTLQQALTLIEGNAEAENMAVAASANIFDLTDADFDAPTPADAWEPVIVVSLNGEDTPYISYQHAVRALERDGYRSTGEVVSETDRRFVGVVEFFESDERPIDSFADGYEPRLYVGIRYFEEA